jgi:hypothetical protein
MNQVGRWPAIKMGNAEPVKSRQARPDDDVVVAIMAEPESPLRYFRWFFEPWEKEQAIAIARRFVAHKVTEGFEFILGHVGYVQRTEEGNPGADYTKTGEWHL